MIEDFIKAAKSVQPIEVIAFCTAVALGYVVTEGVAFHTAGWMLG